MIVLYINKFEQLNNSKLNQIKLISQINLELEELLEKDEYKSIREAIGKEN